MKVTRGDAGVRLSGRYLIADVSERGAVREALVTWYRARAAVRLPAMVETWAPVVGVEAPGCSRISGTFAQYQPIRTRFGSRGSAAQQSEPIAFT